MCSIQKTSWFEFPAKTWELRMSQSSLKHIRWSPSSISIFGQMSSPISRLVNYTSFLIHRPISVSTLCNFTFSHLGRTRVLRFLHAGSDQPLVSLESMSAHACSYCFTGLSLVRSALPNWTLIQLESECVACVCLTSKREKLQVFMRIRYSRKS